uniref:Uncharacterized protein n=1 Tax=Linum usitatissimum TaxID=4006 RepID=G8GJ82_LINUS|nr:hypothetical protein [Linum usitatissimum]
MQLIDFPNTTLFMELVEAITSPQAPPMHSATTTITSEPPTATTTPPTNDMFQDQVAALSLDEPSPLAMALTELIKEPPQPVVGSFLTRKDVNLDVVRRSSFVVRRTMPEIWQTRRLVEIDALERGLFLFRFNRFMM